MRAAALLVLGLLLGFVGAVLQTSTHTIGSVRLPTGTVLTLVAIVLIARAGAWWQGSRLGAITFSVGWLAATLMMGSKTGAGDLILSNGTRQMAYLIGGTLLLSAASGFPLLPADDAPEQPLSTPAGAGHTDA
jgi:hypothetical protein